MANSTVARAVVAVTSASAVIAGVLVGAGSAQAEDVQRVPVPTIQASSSDPATPGRSSGVRIGAWEVPNSNNRVLQTVLHWGTTKNESECASYYNEVLNGVEEVPLGRPQVVYADLPTVNMNALEIAPPPQVGGGLPQRIETFVQPIRWGLDNAGGYMCVFTEMQYFVVQSPVIKKAYSPVGFATGNTAFVQGSNLYPRRPSVAEGLTSIRPGDVDISAIIRGTPRIDESVVSRDLVVSFLPADRRSETCDAAPDTREYSYQDFADANRNISISSTLVGSYLCLRQDLKTNWMNEERQSAQLVLPIVASPTAGFSRLFAATSTLSAALRNVQTLQRAPVLNPELLQEAIEELEEAQAEAEQAQAEVEQQDPAVQQQEAEQLGAGQSADEVVKEAEALVREATTVAKDGERQIATGNSYAALSTQLRKALKTGDAPLVSTTGSGSYQDMKLRVRAPAKQKRGKAKRYRAVVTPKTTGRVSFALVRQDDSGAEIVEASKVRKLNKKGKKSLRWKLPKDMPKGGYTLYVSVKPSGASGKPAFTVGRTLQVR